LAPPSRTRRPSSSPSSSFAAVFTRALPRGRVEAAVFRGGRRAEEPSAVFTGPPPSRGTAVLAGRPRAAGAFVAVPRPARSRAPAAQVVGLAATALAPASARPFAVPGGSARSHLHRSVASLRGRTSRTSRAGDRAFRPWRRSADGVDDASARRSPLAAPEERGAP
jgi:hypothetical protein